MHRLSTFFWAETWYFVQQNFLILYKYAHVWIQNLSGSDTGSYFNQNLKLVDCEITMHIKQKLALNKKTFH